MAKFENGVIIQYLSLGHDQLTLTSAAVALSSLPSFPASTDRLRRVVVRNLGQPIDWRADGVAPDGNSFRALADEIVVLDTDFTQFKMKLASTATGNADVRVAYFGT